MEPEASPGQHDKELLGRALPLCLASRLFLFELRRAALSLADQHVENPQTFLWVEAYRELARAADRLDMMWLRTGTIEHAAPEDQLPPEILDSLVKLAEDGALEVYGQDFLQKHWSLEAVPLPTEFGESPVAKALKALQDEERLDKWRTEMMKKDRDL